MAVRLNQSPRIMPPIRLFSRCAKRDAHHRESGALESVTRTKRKRPKQEISAFWAFFGSVDYVSTRVDTCFSAARTESSRDLFNVSASPACRRAVGWFPNPGTRSGRCRSEVRQNTQIEQRGLRESEKAPISEHRASRSKNRHREKARMSKDHNSGRMRLEDQFSAT